MAAERSTPYLETPEVVRLCDLPYSTLDYWVRTGLVAPSVRGGSGRRRTRQWSVLDVVCVRALKELRDAGASVRVLKQAQAMLRDTWSATLRDHMLYWDGGDLIQVDEWKNLVSLIAAPGQGVLHIVALSVDALRAEAESVAAISGGETRRSA
ncbi:MerR family transcriptional regulator [Microbacterium sp. NPDC057650]|uniref:MerR family transcriptional regulator n=1 Tax=unclassified Microbacterium TaxID=2609290 RepID=UPI0036705670